MEHCTHVGEREVYRFSFVLATDRPLRRKVIPTSALPKFFFVLQAFAKRRSKVSSVSRNIIRGKLLRLFRRILSDIFVIT
ncbi:MAG: hypothetical protein IJ718_04785 [Paludibacteraceae bacterium]|nr:hypothetical protein [Paludibacteraceae bacterium]